MPTSVRLDARTEAKVRRLAQRTHRSKSEVIREAIRRLTEAQAHPADGDTVYSQIADLVGAARGGSRNLAAQTEAVLRRMFSRRSRKT